QRWMYLLSPHPFPPTSSVFFSTSNLPHRAQHSFPTRRSSDLDHFSGFIPMRNQIAQVALRLTVHETLLRHPKIVVHLGEIFVSRDRKSTRLNSSHLVISYAVFCLKKKTDS